MTNYPEPLNSLWEAIAVGPRSPLARGDFTGAIQYLAGFSLGVDSEGRPNILRPFGDWIYESLGYPSRIALPFQGIILTDFAHGDEKVAAALLREKLRQYCELCREGSVGIPAESTGLKKLDFPRFFRAAVKRPAMYITTNVSYGAVVTFLIAFGQGRLVSGAPNQIAVFAEWLRTRVNYDGAKEWYDFIRDDLASGDDEMALAKLLELFGEFVDAMERGEVSLETESGEPE